MKPVDEPIRRFLSRHHVLTLATVDGGGNPWCSHAFYAFDSDRGLLIFSSNGDTAHAANMESDSRVSVSVVLETRIVGRVQGCQIRGTAARGGTDDKKRYFKRFPYAAAMPDAEIWVVTMDSIKYTDNTLGFGKKLLWQRDSDTER